MEKFELKIERKLVVTAEDMDDIMCAALEGGVCYWCNEAIVVGAYLGEWAHEQIARGGKLQLVDAEDGTYYELTREKLLHGIQMAREQEYYRDYEWWDGEKLDTCNVDAEVADVIVQLALFDEIVFG